MRGPGVMPTTPGRPARPTGGARFDADVVAAVKYLEARWHDRLPLVEYAVEEVPALPPGWDDEDVPLSVLVHGQGSRPHRVVVYRRPVERRVRGRQQQRSLVLTLLVAHVADLLNMTPDDVDPRNA